MQLKDLLVGVEVIESTAPAELNIGSVCYDSRRACPGSLFVAVSGFQTDGHRFIGKAVENGAAAVLCERKPEEDVPYVLVPSSRKALAMLGANLFGHPADAMKVIGITGTNGKTSSTMMLKSVLEQTVGAKVGLIGTIQNMIGDKVIPTERTTPESYELQQLFAQMRDAGCTHVVMEVSSHALCLNRVDGISFDVGAFTNLTEDHLDFHKTMEAYRDAKAELFRRCAVGTVNADDPAAKYMLSAANGKILCSSASDRDAELYASDISLHSDAVSMTVHYNGEAAALRIGIPGTFTVYNVMTVVGCSLLLGIPLQKIAAAFDNVTGVKGRIEVVPTPGKPYTVLIDYAHTPDALENILRSCRDFCKGRLITVFGCGGDRDPLKRPIMGAIAAERSDYVIVTSDNPRTEDPLKILNDILAGMKDSATPFLVEEDRKKAIRIAMQIAGKDDIIVLAGKGHETYQERGKVKYHLDEREEVAEALREQR